MLATILFFQIDGLMNPDHKKNQLLSNLAMNDLVLIFFIFALMVIFQSFYLLKKKIIKWYDMFYYIFMTALIFILIILNGHVILDINDIKIN